MELPKKEEKILSASRIKTLESCSYTYFAQYLLKLPNESNSGSCRGTCCHLVFEMLSKPKHKHYYDKLIKSGTFNAAPAIKRLVCRGLKKDGFLTDENVELCDKMIQTGLKYDFFATGAESQDSEYEFIIDNENPRYIVKGFIDKINKYKDSIKLLDFKSSKAKFTKDEIDANLQALIYTLACRKKIAPEIKKVMVEFLFLKFPRQPVQKSPEFTDKQLSGLENYLAYIFQIINNFDEKMAVSNLAKHSEKNSWLCGRGATWICPYKNPRDYFILKDKDDKFIKSSWSMIDPQPGQKVEIAHYDGCPAWNF